MATFEEILNKARAGAEKAGQKASDFVEITRMKMNIAEIEKEIAATYEGLGRLVYDAQKSGQDSEDMVRACVENIDELQRDVDEIRDRLYAFKHMQKCDACGAVNDEDAAFCNKCGKTLG